MSSLLVNLKDLFSFSFPSSLNVVVCSNIKLPDPYTLKGLKHELLILVPSLISKGYGQMSEESHIFFFFFFNFTGRKTQTTDGIFFA